MNKNQTQGRKERKDAKQNRADVRADGKMRTQKLTMLPFYLPLHLFELCDFALNSGAL